MRRARTHLRRLLIILTLSAALMGWPVGGLCENLITDVQLSNPVLNLQDDRPIIISWRMERAAQVSAFICNLDGEVVKKFQKKPREMSGVGSLEWDGRDDDGRPVPEGAYLPFIQAASEASHQLFNPTMKGWGQRVQADDINYDAERQQIRYRLSKPALCRIRVGETDGGPLYATLGQWVPRTTGAHQEAWDGRDAQGLVHVAERPKLKITIDAIRLPENSILVTGSPGKHRFERSRGERMPLHPPVSSEVFMHSLHERRFCRDIEITADVEGKSWNKWKLPLLRAIADVRVNIPNREYRAHLSREGAEIYAFLDGQFATEVKVVGFPAHIDINTEQLAAGEHILTINMLSTEDHMGTYSLVVRVER